MPTVIQAVRPEVSRTFPIPSFRIRTDFSPAWGEVVVATSPNLLFDPAARGQRTPSNFYSSRGEQPFPIERGEAVYLLPPAVTNRFAGQSRLYYAVAVYRQPNLQDPQVMRLPAGAAPFVNISNSFRGEPQGILSVPGPRGGLAGNGYSSGGDGSLEWGGDAAPAGEMVAVPAPVSAVENTAAPNGGNGRAAPVVQPGSGEGGPTTAVSPTAEQSALAFNYDDGFESSLWSQPQAYAAKTPVSYAQAVVKPEYTPQNSRAAIEHWRDFIQRYDRWRAGVSETRIFPHSAICQLLIYYPNIPVPATGTGFYIGPDLILTAAHCVKDVQTNTEAASIVITPGLNGEIAPFGFFQANRGDWELHPSYDGGFDYDLAVIKVDTPPPDGLYFDTLEDLTQSIQEKIIVCGYAAESVNPDKQHLDGDTITGVSQNLEQIQYNIQTEAGASGSPVFYVTGVEDPVQQMSIPIFPVIGVHVSCIPRFDPAQNAWVCDQATQNQACRLSQAKINWINSVGSGSSAAQALAQHVPPRRARAFSGEYFDVNWDPDVQLVPQMTGMSCWAAAASMIVGWRDQVSIDPSEVARGAGHWSAYAHGLNPADIPSLATAWNLTMEQPQTYTIEGLRYLLEVNGPLWVCEAVPSLHAVVVTGLYGDGTVDGTTVRIRDPWPVGQGAIYTRPLRQYMQEYEAAAINFSDVNIQILHAGGLQATSQAQSYQAGAHRPTNGQTAVTRSPASHRARALSGQHFNVNWDPDVQLVPQMTGMSCWAASASMIVGWRDQISIDPSEVARGAGHWRAYAHGLNPADVPSLATAWGLTMEEPQCYTIEGLRYLLESYGPLWVGEAAPGLHVVVVTGLYGDGTVDGTTVRIKDPWPVGQGAAYTRTLRQFMREYEAAAENFSDVHIQILHAGGLQAASQAQGHQAGAMRPPASHAAYAFAGEPEDYGIEEPLQDDLVHSESQSYGVALSGTPEYPDASRFVQARWYRTPAEPRTIRRVVIHITDGAARTAIRTANYFQDPRKRNGDPVKVSAHYVIGQDGDIVQMVNHSDIAWHARSANSDSIGIEHQANTRGMQLTEDQYCLSAALVRWLCEQYNIPMDREHILGHSEADPNTTHTGCPNALWNWEYFMDMVISGSCYPMAQTAQALQQEGQPALYPFDAGAVDLMRQEFVANAQQGSPQSCIVITNAGLRRLFGSHLQNPDGTIKRLGSTIQDTMGALQGYGLASSAQEFEFNNASGSLTRGVVRPHTLRQTVEQWLLAQADANQMSAWYVFGLSIMDGYHSVVLGLQFSGINHPDTRLYWADQIYSGWDDVTGSLDDRITGLTQQWWDPLPQDRKARTRVTVWPLQVALATGSAFSATAYDDIEGAEEEPAGIAYAMQRSDADIQACIDTCTDDFCPVNPAATAGTANFTLQEFRCRDGTEVPERFRGNVQRVMDNLEVLRAELGGTPITITSGYRTCSYNCTLNGSAGQSRHLCGQAADIQVTGYTPEQVFCTIERLINEGRMHNGGVGIYSNFVHYDVRDEPNHRWPPELVPQVRARCNS